MANAMRQIGIATVFIAAVALAGCQYRTPGRTASAVNNGPNDRPPTIQEQSRNVQGGSFGRE